MRIYIYKEFIEQQGLVGSNAIDAILNRMALK
jgi:predicted ATP-grasp superfamily ATP-dependent carboligase